MNNKKIELTEVKITISNGCDKCPYCFDIRDEYFCGLFMDSLGYSMNRLPECEKIGGGEFLLAKIKEEK